MRTRWPALRTLPTNTCDALVRRPISLTPPFAPLKENARLRETMDRADTFPRSVMTSSVTPFRKIPLLRITAHVRERQDTDADRRNLALSLLRYGRTGWSTE